MLQKATLNNIKKYLEPSSQVLMRADFNVPIKEGKITDPNRIECNENIYLSHHSHNQIDYGTQPQVFSLTFTFGQTQRQKGRKVLDEASL